MTEPTKRCSRCKEEKPLSAFHRVLTTTYTDNGAVEHRAGSPQGYCKPCKHSHSLDRAARLRQQRQTRPPVHA